MQAFLDALNNAKENNNGQPKFIIAHTLDRERNSRSGRALTKRTEKPARNLSMPPAKDSACRTNIISFRKRLTPTLPSTRRSCSRITSGGKKCYNEWRKKNPELGRNARRRDRAKSAGRSLMRKFLNSRRTRSWRRVKPAAKRLQPIAQAMPLLMSGSADLARLDPELHQGRRRFHPRQSKGPQHPTSEFASTACARFMNGISLSRTVSRLGCNLYSFSPIIAAPQFGWQRSRSCRTSTFSRTTRSEWARMVRLTSRSRRWRACG